MRCSQATDRRPSGIPRDKTWEESTKQEFIAAEPRPIREKLDLLDMPEASAAVEAVWEQARLVIVPFSGEERAAASTVEEAKERAKSALKAALGE